MILNRKRLDISTETTQHIGSRAISQKMFLPQFKFDEEVVLLYFNSRKLYYYKHLHIPQDSHAMRKTLYLPVLLA